MDALASCKNRIGKGMDSPDSPEPEASAWFAQVGNCSRLVILAILEYMINHWVAQQLFKYLF